MSAKQEGEWRILEMAMKLERDGEAFYKDAAARTEDAKGKRMFETLARDEVVHFETLQSIYQSLCAGKSCPALETIEKRLGRVKTPHPIFPKAKGRAEKAVTHELEALERGIKAEKDSIALYSKGSKEAGANGTARWLYDRLVEQERAHLAILEGEMDYLMGSGFWFDVFEVDLEG